MKQRNKASCALPGDDEGGDIIIGKDTDARKRPRRGGALYRLYQFLNLGVVVAAFVAGMIMSHSPSSSSSCLSSSIPSPVVWSNSLQQQQLHTATSSNRPGTNRYPNENGLTPLGILSEKPVEFFREFQRKVDESDDAERCRRYNYGYNPSLPHIPRNLYFGSLVASETWELLEIVGTEAYGIYKGMVLVESNRTQNFTPRTFLRLGHAKIIQQIFGTEKIDIRAYVNENNRLLDLTRENAQRDDILVGWKEMGMEPHDVGILADLDETFSRDYLRALKVCDIAYLDYDKHNCYYHTVKLSAFSRTFEGSPECTIRKANGSRHGIVKPNAVIGACLQQIGNPKINPIPERGPGLLRSVGWMGNTDQARQAELQAVHNLSSGQANTTGGALWNCQDIRRIMGVQKLRMLIKALTTRTP